MFYRVQMRLVRRVIVASALAATTVLAGCTSEPAEPVASPTPSETPLFASDEEALAAAEEAYTAYLEVSDALLADPSLDLDALQAVAVGDAVVTTQAGIEELRAAGLRAIGRRAISSLEMQSRTDADVIVHACEDASGVDVRNAENVSVVSPDRNPLTPFEVALSLETGALRVATREFWDVPGICGA